MNLLKKLFQPLERIKPVHIKLWEYGEEVGLKGTSKIDIISWAAREKISSIVGSEFTTTNLLQVYVSQYFLEAEGTVDKSGGKLLVLKAEYLARLEDYRLLKEEKKLTRNANRTALIAVIIAILSLFASIAISIYQINSPIRLNQEQLEIITNKPARLDQEQLELIKSLIEQRKPKPESKPTNEDQIN